MSRNNLALNVTLSALDRATPAFMGMRRSIDRMNRSVRSSETELNRLQRAQKEAFENKAPLAVQNDLARQIDSTTAALDRQKRSYKSLSRRQAHYARGGQSMWQGTKQIGMASGMGYAASRFMQPGFDFDEIMSEVQALTQLDKGSTAMSQLRTQARHLGATTWADPTEVASAQAFYAMAGFDPEQIMEATPGTLDLARAGKVDIGQAADISSNILQAYGLDPSEMGRVSDVLVAGFTGSNTSLAMLGDTMKYVGPVAKDLGISLEESVATAGMLGNIGIQGGQAGTNMRRIYSRLANQNSAGAKAMEAIGVSAEDADGNLREIPDLLYDIMNATSKMSNTKRLGYLTDIVGQEAASSMSSLINEDALKGLEEYHQRIKNSEGLSKKTAEIMGDNLKGDVKDLNSAWTDLRITVAEVNDASLRGGVTKLTDLMRSFGGFVEERPHIVGGLSKIAALAIGIVGSIGAMNVGFGLFSRLVLANPVTAAIALMATAILMVYENWDSVIWFIDEGIQQLDKDISEALGKIPIMGKVAQTTWDRTGDTIYGVTSGFLDQFGKASDAVKYLAEHGSWKTIGTIIEDLTHKAQGFAKTIHAGTHSWMDNKTEQFWDWWYDRNDVVDPPNPASNPSTLPVLDANRQETTNHTTINISAPSGDGRAIASFVTDAMRKQGLIGDLH